MMMSNSNANYYGHLQHFLTDEFISIMFRYHQSFQGPLYSKVKEGIVENDQDGCLRAAVGDTGEEELPFYREISRSGLRRPDESIESTNRTEHKLSQREKTDVIGIQDLVETNQE